MCAKKDNEKINISGVPEGEILLSQISSPSDIKKLSDEQLDRLENEIRDKLIKTVTDGKGCLGRGGHLASNLGVVELTIALHRVFDSPKDKIIWDVGHQSYCHKLLTGRYSSFDTLRTPGGISGFTKRNESEHDPFGAGHSSTSVSAALGIAEAEKLKGGEGYTVAVVGDGSFTGGMIHEALNNCDHTKGLRLIIVINENEMSISKNIGSFASSLSKIRTRPSYFRTKAATRSVLSRVPLVGKPIVKLITDVKRRHKDSLYGSNIFEDLGLYYLGPIDGNDRKMVETMLGEAKKFDQSVVLHIKTQKGKGYQPAEQNPDAYHSLSPRGAKPSGGFSRAFGAALIDEAASDEKIVAVTAAMSRGTGLDPFKILYPERFFDVGIAEEHAVTFGAGLAAGGIHPVTAIYSSFLQRAYDQIVHDVALQQLPVVFCIDRAGLSGGDGATHHGIFDVSFLSSVPGMTIFTPATYGALKTALHTALSLNVPSAIRYPGCNEDDDVKRFFYPEGTPDVPGVRSDECETKGIKNIIVVHGKMVSEAIKAKNILAKKGISCLILLCEYIKPYKKLAAEVMAFFTKDTENVVFLEEEIRSGGFGMNLRDAIDSSGSCRECSPTYTVIATDDDFVTPKKGESVLEAAKVDGISVANTIESLQKTND